MSEYALPCIVCGRELRNVFPGGPADNQPADGIVVRTSGNYGSTVWDSFDGQVLEFDICDPCMVAAGRRGHVLIGRDRRRVRDGDGNFEWVGAEWAPTVWVPGEPADEYELGEPAPLPDDL
jgi:hypothetical protein